MAVDQGVPGSAFAVPEGGRGHQGGHSDAAGTRRAPGCLRKTNWPNATRVSRGTIRQAFAALRADGVIASRRGARRVVMGGPRVQSFGELLSFSRWARAVGEVPGGRVVAHASAGRPSRCRSRAAGHPPRRAQVYHLIRVRLLSGNPVMIERGVYRIGWACWWQAWTWNRSRSLNALRSWGSCSLTRNTSSTRCRPPPGTPGCSASSRGCRCCASAASPWTWPG